LQASYGSFYDGIKQDSLWHLLCTFYFTVRRLLLLVSVVMLSDHPGFQVIIFIFLSKLNIIYII